MANDSGRLSARMGLTASTRDDTCLLARSLKLRPVAGPVVALLSYYHCTNKHVDSDNIAPTLKRCLDGLRLAKVLADDDGRHVLATMQRCVPRDLDPFHGSGPRVILSLYDGAGWQLPHITPSAPATLAVHAASA
jgi:hypothetical protein